MSISDPDSNPVDLGSGPVLQVPARMRDTLPGKLLLLPLPARPFLPAQTMPLVLPEALWRETIERVGNTPHHLVGLVYAGTQSRELPEPVDFRRIGTVVRMHHPIRGDGQIQFVAEGLQRFRILDFASDKAPFVANVDYPEAPLENTQELRAYALAVIAKIKELLPLNPF
ncbi:MAG: endopeptidase La, partial [Betaproteobacteria bacterium]|nr:endopeptidase La [Betaproteobacteria bacterium]